MSNGLVKTEEGVELAESSAPADPPGNAESAKVHSEEQLDEALEKTFPSSDPVAVRITQ